ncbi:Mob1/phocein [Cercophora scortea]|uniref:Mob1/phocein n=1 Tax=Cercophora scortea TaxID=314031 RepID=A0AAE0J5C0_9PEZI|nr:Mob1/phocein [Cercophora scortea]
MYKPNARFRGQRSPNSPGPGEHSPASSPTTTLAEASRSSSSLAVKLPPLPSSPSLTETIGGMEKPAAGQPSPEEILASYHLPAVKPVWLNANYAKHIVKGNFLTLSAKPKTVEMGEWIAHQVVDHWRMLITFIRLVHDKEEDGSSICSPRKCPKMTAGANHSFTWLNSRLQPVEIPAYEYLSLVQRYISGKLDDGAIFPTAPEGVSYADHPAFCPPAAPSSDPPQQDWIGKRSGFPPNFLEICQTIFRQMFRVYAHLYWSHFDDMFRLDLEKAMNSCFSHFILTATTLNLLKKADVEPMQPLIDLWAALGTFPPGSKAYENANVQVGNLLVQKAGGPPPASS